MKVLIAVKGTEAEDYFRRVADVAPLDRADTILLVHVIDTGARGGVELNRERFFGRRELGGDRSRELTEAEEDRAQAALAFAHAALAQAGVPAGLLREMVERGRPRETIRELAEPEGVDLIVVGGRGGKPGPHSLGKTARYLVDHAPHAVLLVR